MNSMTTDVSSPLTSTYADDQVIAEILPMFLANMPKYTNNLQALIESRDYVGAGRVCHDLKGTSGGYGYPDIATATQVLETELKKGQDLELIRSYLDVVCGLCERARLAL